MRKFIRGLRKVGEDRKTAGAGGGGGMRSWVVPAVMAAGVAVLASAGPAWATDPVVVPYATLASGAKDEVIGVIAAAGASILGIAIAMAGFRFVLGWTRRLGKG
jgi:hypothetical protein